MFEDKRILGELKRGNGDALRRIYDQYKRDLLTLATALLYDRSTAEDVVQDVFAGFIESSRDFKLTGSLKGYLSVCVANNARNRNKAGVRRLDTGLDHIDPVSSDVDRPDLAAVFGEESQHLARALAKLPYAQREVVMLHVHSALTFREIAELTKESINTLKGRYRYGLDKLRTLLNSEAEQ